ncbi:MAG TPA: DUF2867 domain-containing protein [Mycobacteriales bacterium]|nr:DUF2867 domain-containing protein [Mycobacteriales bacterium]
MGEMPGFVSAALRDIPRPDFVDVAAAPLPAGAPADPARWAAEVFSVAGAPVPVRALLGLRQLLVPMIGVPRAGRSVFTVREVVGEEALIVADDVHLDFRVGVGVDTARSLVRVTTVVRLKGRRGRLYFGPVRLLHSPIVHAMLDSACRRLDPARPGPS